MKEKILALMMVACIVLCSCNNNTNTVSEKAENNENSEKRIELTAENWNDYIKYEFSVDADVDTQTVYDDLLPVYKYCNVDMNLTSNSDRLMFEDVTLTFELNTVYADLFDNLNFNMYGTFDEFTEGTHEITIDLDLFGNGHGRVEVYDFLCYIPDFPVQGFSLKSISGYAILD